MRRFQVWLLLVAGTVAAACAGSSPESKSPQPEPLPSARTAPRSLIDVRPLTITFQGLPIARLLADGRTESVGPNSPGDGATFVPGPTLRGDGTIVLTKSGFTARIESNGDIYVVNPPGADPREHLFGRISGDQLSLAGSAEPWAVRIEDTTIVFNGPGARNEIEGAIDASSRHTALVMTAAFLIDMSITAR